MRLNFDVPMNWTFPTIDKLIPPKKGAIKIGPFGSSLKKAEYSESGIRVLGIDHVHPNKLVWEKPKYIPTAKYEELTQYTVQTGDVLVTNMGTVGRTCFVPNNFPKAIISSHLIKVSPDFSKVEPSYLCWALNFCPIVVAQIQAKCQGAIMAGFNTSLLKSIHIPLPPLKEQRRIVDILDKADAVRRKRQQAIALTEELLRSAFLEMFGDPITNPKGWIVKPLSSLCSVRRGGSPRPIEAYLGGSVPWIKIGDATESDDIYIYKTAEAIKPEGVKKSLYLEPGSLIFANCGVSLGFARILKIGGCIHDGWLSFSNINESLNEIYLLKLLNSLTNHFRQIAPSGTQPNLNTSIMNKFGISVPPIRLQVEFANIVTNMSASKQGQTQAVEEANNLFNSLLQRAFCGEL